MIIDSSYFKHGELFIPNVVNLNAQPKTEATQKVKSDLDLFIDKYERELLLNALGVDLYEELVTICSDNLLEEVGNEKWLALVEGETYQVNDETYIFDGLRGFQNESLVAYYVFCRWMENDDSVYSTVGTVRDTAKNAISVAASPKYIKAWNNFINKYQGKHRGTMPRVIFNPSGDIGLDYFGQEDVNRTLYQYLSDKNDSSDPEPFPDFRFKLYRIKTSMGI